MFFFISVKSQQWVENDSTKFQNLRGIWWRYDLTDISRHMGRPIHLGHRKKKTWEWGNTKLVWLGGLFTYIIWVKSPNTATICHGFLETTSCSCYKNEPTTPHWTWPHLHRNCRRECAPGLCASAWKTAGMLKVACDSYWWKKSGS